MAAKAGEVYPLGPGQRRGSWQMSWGAEPGWSPGIKAGKVCPAWLHVLKK
jgi:hypothetical protein